MNLTVLSVVVGVILSNLRFAATNCGDLVNTFGHQLEELSGCVVNFTQSAGVCVNCIDEYLQFQSAYREFHLA